MAEQLPIMYFIKDDKDNAIIYCDSEHKFSSSCGLLIFV